jgi:hypothetical protein
MAMSEPGGVTTPENALGSGEMSTRVQQDGLRVRGREILAPSVQIEGRTVVTVGRCLKIAVVRDEELIEGDTVSDLASFVSKLKTRGLKADIFTFAQRVPDARRRYDCCTEWENAAALTITSFSHWLKDVAEYSIRKGVNRASKLGVTARIVEFDDQLLDAICRIYNESPVRQGKSFWHYGKDSVLVRRALDTYIDRSVFIGAYYQDQLIGFVKMTWVGSTGTITQILSMRSHFDKKPNNILIAKAIELCESMGKRYFIYGSFVYYDPTSTLTEFKRRIGFQAIPLPRYYIPMTLRGKIALKLGLHRGVAANTPQLVFKQYLRIRKSWAEYKMRQPGKTDASKENR